VIVHRPAMGLEEASYESDHRELLPENTMEDVVR
jgi:hypothetical protein